MILASILISSREEEELRPSQRIIENIASFKAVHPGIRHALFTTQTIRELIGKHFDGEVLNAFDRLRPFAYKSDLARYCILHEFGGVYADISIYFMQSWWPQRLAAVAHPPGTAPANRMRLGLFRDFLSSTIWDTATTVISAPPRHKAFLKAVEMICANVKAEYYGPTSLCPTGPTLFGKAVASTCDAEDMIVGYSRWIAPSPPEQENALIRETSHGLVFGNRLIAVRRKRGGGPLSELGIEGGNQYPEMWTARQVYGPPGPADRPPA